MSHVRHIRPEEKRLVQRLIAKQRNASDELKAEMLTMLFGPVSAPKHAPDRPNAQYGDWCAIHDQRRLKREVGSRYRCTACDRDYMRRKRAKDKGEES